MKYILASKEERLQTKYNEIVGRTGKIVWMPPEQFLKLCFALTELSTNEESFKKIRYRLQNELPLDFLMLKVDLKKNKVVGHDGRHRATVATQMKIKKVPVLIWIKNRDFLTVNKLTEEQNRIIEKAEFEPEWKDWQPDHLVKLNGRFFCVPRGASIDTLIDILEEKFITRIDRTEIPGSVNYRN